MELTFIGVIQLAIGCIIVLAGSLRSAFVFLMISGLFDGSAAILLPALGGSSIPPIQFAILFVYLRILAPRGGFLRTLAEAIAANRLLLLYTVYGVTAAMIAPRLFAGAIDVAPLRFEDARSLFDTVPLQPTSQNITASVYLIGSLLVALAAYVVCRHRGGANSLISAAVAVAWIHVGLGVATAVTHGTAVDSFFDLFRNGNYAQLDQEYQGFVRIRGLAPESSSYAGFGFAYFVLNVELWYRSIRPRATGFAALALALILLISTSSSAYVGLAGYALFFMLRLLLLPDMADVAKMRQLLLGLLSFAVLIAIVMLARPNLAGGVSDMIVDMTVGKTDSSSGQQRLFWAMQGWTAFMASFGLGIGPGSFRSSSIVMAMLGSMGVIGVGLFSAYAISVLQPLRASTIARTDDLARTIGGALATAALLSLLPAAVASAMADPGPHFALMAGAALALRPVRQRGRASQGSLTAPRSPLTLRELRELRDGGQRQKLADKGQTA
jgi:hypothetical protein